MADTATAPTELVLEVASDLYDDTHPGWQAEVQDLVSALERETGAIRRDVAPQPGEKGGLTTLVLSGFTGASVEVMASMLIGWLSAHAGRKLRLRTAGAEAPEVAVDSQVDQAAVRELVELLKRATAPPSE